jgi:peptidoglycan/xylan/chitin deacetylase (PgdA/CDA1 family)
MLTSFIYHDVVADGKPQDSGFTGAAADSYKLDNKLFGAHLEAIQAASAAAPAVRFAVDDLVAAAEDAPRRVLLTFDDGGVGAIRCTADLLEARGMRGLFFVTTDYIGTRGFVGDADIRALHARGHGIGSHSASHPMRMTACSATELAHEWNSSIARLADILGQPVQVASVPGGYYARAVAEAASGCGIRVLFTSEPTSRPGRVAECNVLGRYSVKDSTPATEVAALVAGRWSELFRRQASWGIKKAIKRVGGRQWLAIRDRYFERGKSS